MAFTTEDKKISGLLSKRVYLIPRNQRRYVWKSENWKDLLEDLEFSINDSRRAHFMGSIVLEKTKYDKTGAGVEVYSIIDGQQRITTFQLLLSVIMYIFKERSEQANFEGLKSYLITNNLANQLFCKLISDRYPSLEVFIRNVCDWDRKDNSIDKIISDSSTASKHNDDVFDAVIFFYNKLKDSTTEEVEGIRNALLETNVVEIIASSEEDAYTIFEILNARGQILEDYELVKNFIMRYYEPSNAVDTAKQRWETEIVQPLGDYMSQFIKHYVTHCYDVKNGKGHNQTYGIIKSETNKQKVVELLDDLCRKASYYKIIINPQAGDEGNCSQREYNVYSFMRSNRGVLFRPIFLSLIHHYKTGEISCDLYERVIEFIKYFFICYNLLGRLTSNKLTETVQSSAKAIEVDYSTEVLSKFINGLVRRMPSLEEFTKSFQLIGWSKKSELYKESSQKKKTQIALETLESIESGSWNIAPYTIEHLYPDSDDRENANIGNLVLLEEKANSSNANKPFADKVDGYFDSRFQTARNVYKRYHQHPESFCIDTRAKAMAARIYNFIIEQGASLQMILEPNSSNR
ncbi:MAG: DUF262 domain-containing protein [Bacteroidales bacterium]|nr:DUF262 domain-containing protein [Bacteroidales bacterium]